MLKIKNMNIFSKRSIRNKLVFLGTGAVFLVGLGLFSARPAAANSWNHTGTGGHYVVIGGISYDIWHDGQGAVVTIYGRNYYFSPGSRGRWVMIGGVKYYDQGQLYKNRRHHK
jgi:hypothetical protein